MKSISITFTLKGVTHYDTLRIDNPTTERVAAALARKLRRVTKSPAVLVSWSAI